MQTTAKKLQMKYAVMSNFFSVWTLAIAMSTIQSCVAIAILSDELDSQQL